MKTAILLTYVASFRK